MNDSTVDSWQASNEEYLAAALAWMRLRLTRLAASTTTAPVERSERRCFLSFRRRRRPAASATTASAVPDRRTTRIAEKAAARMAEAASVEPPPALVLLARRFGLSRFEMEVLLLCVAMELDTRTASLCARAQDNPSLPYPTFALAMTLFDSPSWDVLSPERPLRHWQLMEIGQSGNQSLTASPLRADERIVSFVKGLNYLDDRLAPLLLPLETGDGEVDLAPSQQHIVDSIIERLEQVNAGEELPIIQLAGTDSVSKQLVAARTATELGLYPHRLPAGLLPAPATELETIARLWQRESMLLPLALYVDARDTDDSTQSGAGVSPIASVATPLHRFLARSNCLLFLDTREVRQDLGRSAIIIDSDRPTPAEQRAAWTASLGMEDSQDSPALLAGQFNLNVSTIRHIAQTARSETPQQGPDLHHRLWEACLVRTRPWLDILAQRLDPRPTWEDIVLPPEQERLLHQVAEQVGQRSMVYDEWGFRNKMNRGLGISALFAGESGTGKTMAAEVVANDLRLDLYRIDLSAVVSKYIGETEKNLRRLFDAAEDGGAILFFDEADALFGKRSEVKDSHDRYANIEINYLLQRMEMYHGLAILATNMKSALDQSFLRRLRFVVNLPFPGPKERKVIWQKVFPAETPVDGLDYDRLAHFNLTGGSIHSIALNAAFLAAQQKTAVTMELALQAARTEFRKLEKPVNEGDFRWKEPAGVAS